MVDERNLTVLAYIEAVALRIDEGLPAFRTLLRNIVERIRERTEADSGHTFES
jgi:hypothetical protein